MQLDQILKLAIEKGASDIHLTVGVPPIMRCQGDLSPLIDRAPLTREEIQTLAFSVLNEKQKQEFTAEREMDCAYEIPGVCRFRVNLYWQKDNIGIAVRSIPSIIPTPEQIGLPQSIINFTNCKNGLVLVTGQTGSGKSTTLAALINKINIESDHHILTIEDPIEFVYQHGKSIVNQRQVGSDTKTFASALKHALREDPDVILVGEMRDLETISATLTIAETGHLAFATLHTIDVAQTIDRVINVFPAHQQQQIRMVLSVVLRGIVCQQLLPRKDGKGRVAVREVLVVDSAIANMIREGQTPQIYSRLQTGGSLGMNTMDAAIQKLYSEGIISREVAQKALVRPVQLID